MFTFLAGGSPTVSPPDSPVALKVTGLFDDLLRLSLVVLKRRTSVTTDHVSLLASIIADDARSERARSSAAACLGAIGAAPHQSGEILEVVNLHVPASVTHSHSLWWYRPSLLFSLRHPSVRSCLSLGKRSMLLWMCLLMMTRTLCSGERACSKHYVQLSGLSSKWLESQSLLKFHVALTLFNVSPHSSRSKETSSLEKT